VGESDCGTASVAHRWHSPGGGPADGGGKWVGAGR